jgi:hypothetical protein
LQALPAGLYTPGTWVCVDWLSDWLYSWGTSMAILFACMCLRSAEAKCDTPPRVFVIRYRNKMIFNPGMAQALLGYPVSRLP